MKILVVGMGRCGSRLADEFDKLNKIAKRTRGIEIITGTFAIDTDTTALSALNSIKADYRRRILIGLQEHRGQGMVAQNEIGADIARKEVDKIINALRLVRRFQETDAFLVVTSGAGGTGSGSTPIIIQNLKERYRDKAVYGLIVFPYDREIQTEKRFILNTASCLKSSYLVSDALFLVDNQNFIYPNSHATEDNIKINQLIIEPFYNLLCAGEEKKAKHIGGKLMDAGEIIQTVKGWTVLGHGKSYLPFMKQLLCKSLNFRKKSAETEIGMKVMEEAISNFSFRCNPSDAASALYLLSAPVKEITMNLLDNLGDYMKNLAKNAVIRSGDYPIRRSLISIDVILSQLGNIDKVQKIYEVSVDGRTK